MQRSDVNFDRVAADYDATRGGDARAFACARDVVPHLLSVLPGDMLEIGVGTGIVAAAVRAEAPQVVRFVGIDISVEMLAKASQRLPGAVVRASASQLPFGDARFDAALAVHVLHVVPDLDATLAEAARVLRPGGRLVAVHGEPQHADDALARALDPLRDMAPRQDSPETVVASAASAGFALVEQRPSAPRIAEYSPTQLADSIDGRMWSYLWTIDDETWAAQVVPVIEVVRAMPDPDRVRPHESRMTLTVLERAG
jgi:ubiquinone/menaquinone biosynthesis C-methylase UbiE